MAETGLGGVLSCSSNTWSFSEPVTIQSQKRISIYQFAKIVARLAFHIVHQVKFQAGRGSATFTWSCFK